MEGGFITKLIVGGILMSLFIGGLIGVMSSLGTNYNVALENEYNAKKAQFEGVGSSLQSQFNNASIVQLGADIDANAQDQAQFRGLTAGEQQKTSSGNIFAVAMDQIYEVLPFDNSIKIAILSLIGISLAIGIIYLLFKVVP